MGEPRAMIDAHRWRKRTDAKGRGLALLTPEPATPEEHAITRALVLRLLRELPALERRAIVVTYFDGATEDERARALGCSTVWAWTIHQRALAKMRRAAKRLEVQR